MTATAAPKMATALPYIVAQIEEERGCVRLPQNGGEGGSWKTYTVYETRTLAKILGDKIMCPLVGKLGSVEYRFPAWVL